MICRRKIFFSRSPVRAAPSAWILVGALGGSMLLPWLTGCNRGADGGAPDGEAKQTSLQQVETVRPERRDLVHTIELPASLEAYEQATLYAKASGYLKSIRVDKGDRVRRGQVLAELEIPEMVQQEAQVEAKLAETKATAELKRLTFERLSRVREKEPDVVSQQELDIARASMESARAHSEVALADKSTLETLMDYSRLRAPFDGVVTERFVDPGAFIQSAAENAQAAPVVKMVNDSVMRAYVEIPDRQVLVVHKGTPVTLTLEALAGNPLEGELTRIASALDPRTRTMKVEADFPNPDGTLLHGMYATMTLSLDERPRALTLPAEVLVTEGGKSYVLIVDGGAIARRAVSVGIDDGRTVEIEDGLDGEERVVIGDRSRLREGMKVTAIDREK